MPAPSNTSSIPVAIVTGAGSGIGRATSVALSRAGYALVLAGRGVEALEETAGQLVTRGAVHQTDMGDASSARELVRFTHETFGRVDLLVNNAGHAPLAPIDQTTPAMLDETYRVNAIGPASAIAAVWPIMVAQKRGCIVNISSMATRDPFPGFFAYAGAKAACNLMAVSCAKEGAAQGIRAFAVAPGAVETAMLRRHFNEDVISRERCLTPDEVAAVIVECALGRRDQDNGTTIFLASR